MTATLHDSAVLDHEDLIGGLNGGKAVRDHDGRPTFQGDLERPLNLGFGFGVEMRGGLVEDHDRWILQQNTGQRDARLLAAGEPVAAFADRGVVTVGETGNHVVDLGRPAGSHDVFDRRLRPCVPQVAEDRVVEHVSVLGYDADAVAKAVECDVSNVETFNLQRPVGDFVEPRNDRRQSGLASTARSDDCGHGAGFNNEGNVVEDPCRRVGRQDRGAVLQ